ncbi:unnamed protein product, partial [marine sediment metagenome]
DMNFSHTFDKKGGHIQDGMYVYISVADKITVNLDYGPTGP